MWTKETAVKRPDIKEPEMTMTPPFTPPQPVEERRQMAWVGKSVVFKGTLTSSEDMTIDGHVEGTIEVRDQGLIIGPDADIRAQIVAKTVTIHGTVVGNIRATAKVDIRASGRVEGDLVSPRVAIAEGALVCGRVDTSDEESESAAKRRGKLAIV